MRNFGLMAIAITTPTGCASASNDIQGSYVFRLTQRAGNGRHH